jgi:hypothetical protein
MSPERKRSSNSFLKTFFSQFAFTLKTPVFEELVAK